MEQEKTAGRMNLWPLIAKTAVVLLLVALFIDFMLPDFSQVRAQAGAAYQRFKGKVDKVVKDERTKLYALSFVQNPAALYRASEISERDGKRDSAIRDMELAIGLLEMHSADKAVIKRYNDRLAKLKVEPKPEAKPEAKPAK